MTDPDLLAEIGRLHARIEDFETEISDLHSQIEALVLALDGEATRAESARNDALEECATIAASWQRPDAIRLAAGEMSAQEMRTAQAVAGGIERTIRALKEK